jgi:hypothetical protein
MRWTVVDARRYLKQCGRFPSRGHVGKGRTYWNVMINVGLSIHAFSMEVGF